jgi:hypothetical protein
VQAAVQSLSRHLNFKEGSLEWAAFDASLKIGNLGTDGIAAGETARFLTPEKDANLSGTQRGNILSEKLWIEIVSKTSIDGHGSGAMREHHGTVCARGFETATTGRTHSADS